MRGLEGRVVLVTGAASGIGRATAERLVDERAKVALVDRDADVLAEVAAALTEDGGQVGAYRADVARLDEVQAAVGGAVRELGGLHGVVTSAGVFDPADMAPIGEADPAVFAQVLGVNLTGTFLVVRAALPHLTRHGGSIVTVASTAGIRGHGFGAAYTASKGGVVALTKLLALQYAAQAVRANCVCPGFVATGMNREARNDAQFMHGVQKSVPLGRIAQAAELASVICHLLSDDASYTTGQVLAVDGGATAR
jgi:NAD(P)-dependent dehydrogenase (short-subunit alcohol dehydrogenase family)